MEREHGSLRGRWVQDSMSRMFDALQRSGVEQSGVEYEDVISVLTEVFEVPLTQQESTADVKEQTFPLQASIVQSCPETLIQRDVEAVPAEFRSVKANPSNRLVYFTEPDGLAAEKFRFLAVRLRQLQQKRTLKKVLITSTIPQEGKSLVAANLACTLARRGQQSTLLLDGDLRRPSVAKLFGLGSLPGVSESLQSERPPHECIYQIKGTRLCILPSGNATQHTLELIQSGKMPALMEHLSALFEWIVIDSPPVLPLADTSIWSRVADGILLVARQGVTERSLLKKGLDSLDRSRLLGTVLNGSNKTVRSDYYYQAAVKE